MIVQLLFRMRCWRTHYFGTKIPFRGRYAGSFQPLRFLPSRFQTWLRLGIIALQLQLCFGEDYFISRTIGLISLTFFTSIQIFLLLNDIPMKIILLLLNDIRAKFC